MIAEKLDTGTVDGYIELLENLSPNNKLDIVSKLSASIKNNIHHNKSIFQKSFGAFDSGKTAK